MSENSRVAQILVGVETYKTADGQIKSRSAKIGIVQIISGRLILNLDPMYLAPMLVAEHRTANRIAIGMDASLKRPVVGSVMATCLTEKGRPYRPGQGDEPAKPGEPAAELDTDDMPF